MKEEMSLKPETRYPQVPIAVIGIGCIFPKAETLKEYWSNLKNRVDAVTEIPGTHWKTEDYYHENPRTPDCTYAARGGFISPVDFNPMEFAIAPNTLEATDTSQLLGLIVAKKTLEDAGYGKGREFDRDRTSVILGVTGTLELVIPLGARLGHPHWRRALRECGVDEEVSDEVIRRISDSYVGWQEDSFPGLLGNVVAGRIANVLNLGGTNCVVDAACASSFSALHLACLELISGRSDMVLTGGVDTFNDIFMYMCFSKTPALSPTGDARPFDRECDGTILGEGLGMIALKRLDDAQRDGDRVYAVIRGIGTSSDGKGSAIFAPKADGQVKALLEAYKAAGISPRTVELVEAHGTGTRVGDATELESLTRVYSDRSESAQWCALGSVKSQIGHTKAAAGIAGLIKIVMALYHKVLPPTIKVTSPIEQLKADSPFYLNTEKRPWVSAGHPRRAAVSAFGFGGSNFHCVAEEHKGRKSEIDWDDDVQIVALASQSHEELRRKLDGLDGEMPWKEFCTRAHDTRASFDPSAVLRLVLVVERGRRDSIRKARALLEKEEVEELIGTPEGIFLGKGPLRGSLGVLFPGQGSQYVGMLRDLLCQFPDALDTLYEANGHFRSPYGEGLRLSDQLYPPPPFDDDTRTRYEQELRDTRVAQPALGAVSLAAIRVLEYFGVKAQAYAGHSFGELTALCASGRVTPAAFHRLASLRGALMGGLPGDRGSMLAVQAEMKRIEAIMGEHGLDLVIANMNAPNQAVLSGATGEIEKASKIFNEFGVRCTRLPVSAAFHSPLVSDAEREFGAALEAVEIRSAQVPVFSNTTGSEYPAGESESRVLLAGQLAKPVKFMDEILEMNRMGVRTFVEAGPGARLTGLVKAIIGPSGCEAIALDSSSGKRSGLVDLARMLAHLAALGHEIKLQLWAPSEPAPATAQKPALIIPLCGANYVKPDRKKSDGVQIRRAHANRSTVEPATDELGHKAMAGPAGDAQAPGAAAPSPEKGVRASMERSSLLDALRFTQENMSALQSIQEQTARLHQQFLQNQNAALCAFQALVDQQQRLIGEHLGLPSQASALTAVPSTLPAFTSPSHPPPAEIAASLAPAADTHFFAVLETAPSVEAGPLRHTPLEEAHAVLIEVVSEKTGYPAEMLDLSMTLDADLGIDSIKRVEILSALQDRLPNAPPVKSEHMGTLKSLGQILEFLSGESHVPQASSARESGADITGILLEVIADKTGYPADMLDLSMTLDSDLGIDSIKRVEILSALQDRLPDSPPVTSEHMSKIKNLGDIVLFLSPTPPAVAASQSQIVHEPCASAPGRDVTQVVLEVIAEKTGYPAEMLDLSMALDSDLGIDSIKRVEILSSLQDKLPKAPPIKSGQMGELKTLDHIVKHLSAPLQDPEHRKPVGFPPAAETTISAVPLRSTETTISQEPLHSTETSQKKETQNLIRMILARQRLNGSTARTRLPVKAGDAVWITDDHTALSKAVEERLRAIGLVPAIIDLDSIDGISAPAFLAGLVILAPRWMEPDTFLRKAFRLLQAAGPSLRAGADTGTAAFVTVSRLDGSFGIEGLSEDVVPHSGGLAGLAKTARHEWPQVRCKALDLAADFTDLEEAASAIVEEMFIQGPLEVGLSPGGRCAIELTEVLPEKRLGPPPLGEGDVVLITGGARGITAQCAIRLASSFSGKAAPALVLLGRSPSPSPEPPWLEPLTDEHAIKKAIAAEMGRSATPRDVKERYERHVANREMLKTLARIEALGSEVHYRSVDITDAGALTSVIDEIRTTIGPVRGLIHGAGILADRLIEDKTEEEFERVYATKVRGIRNLLDALDKDDLRVLIFFSSSTGRYGRRGQADYAVANEVLNKLAQQQARLRPKCRVAAINWGPWDGGMVTPDLRKIFEREGVGLIALEAGADLLLQEFCSAPDGPVEIVVHGKAPHHGEARQVIGTPAFSRAFELQLSVGEFPFLLSHVMDGRAVLPASIMVEWLAHGALHGNPGLIFHGFDSFKVLKGIRLDEHETVAVKVMAGRASKRGGFFVVPVEIQSEQSGKLNLNACAEIVLAARLPGQNGRPEAPGSLNPYPIADIYREVLFHGPDFHGIHHIEGWSSDSITVRAATAPAPQSWIGKPLRSTWLVDPLALDCSFQMMILWSHAQCGAPSLPCGAARFRRYAEFPADGVVLAAHITGRSAHGATADIDFMKSDGTFIARMEGYEFVIDESLKGPFARNRLSQEVLR
jgi:acyl transferase domain-containing protein/NAD(P)-dependent dehydrogenase (short-subunit alcohol dehydrogenase family)